jgi:SAM-dependent methyltransferase
MATPLLIGLGVVGSLAAVSVAWRFASRRQSLPCPVWLRWFVELDNPFTSTNRSNVIVQQLDLRPGMRVLDLGCGPGRVTIPIARAVGPDGGVDAIDVQPGMLARAAQLRPPQMSATSAFADARRQVRSRAASRDTRYGAG